MRAFDLATVIAPVFAIAAIVAPAFADDAPRKIDFTAPLIVDGTPVINDDKCPLIPAPANAPQGTPATRACTTPATFGDLFYKSLTRFVPNQSWDDGKKMNDLAKLVRTAKDYPLLPDQKKLIETSLAGIMPPPIIGAVNDLFEPAN